MNWDDFFNLAQDYCRRHGNLAMPSTYWVQGVNLGAWLSRQRVCRLPDALHPLSPRQIELLDSLGMDWELRRRDWETCFGYAEQYYKAHGDLCVSPGRLSDGFDLYTWLVKQRRRYAVNHSSECVEEDASGQKNYGKPLTEEQIERLESIGMVWNLHEDAWERSFALAEQYFNEHGNLSVPKHYEVDGVNLSHWIWAQRQTQAGTGANKGKRLTDAQVRRLEAIGMEWAPKAKGFGYYYDLAKRFFDAYGHTDFPDGEVLIDGEPLPESGEVLRKWKSEQEDFLMEREGKVIVSKRRLLYEIGISPTGWETSWGKNYRAAEAYYREHGDLLVPFYYRTEEGVGLGKWITAQRMKKKGTAKTRLTEDQIAQLERIGMVWDTGGKRTKRGAAQDRGEQ